MTSTSIFAPGQTVQVIDYGEDNHAEWAIFVIAKKSHVFNLHKFLRKTYMCIT